MSNEPVIVFALRNLMGNQSMLEGQECQAIADEAMAGSAPAQYIVATAFENLGDLDQANEWYRRSAEQQYAPAFSKLPAAANAS